MPSPPDELRGEYGLLAVVADGMGGLSDGDKVSQAAVGAMLDGFCAAPGDGSSRSSSCCKRPTSR